MVDTIHAYYSFGSGNSDLGNFQNPELFLNEAPGKFYTIFRSIEYPLLSFKVFMKDNIPARIQFEGSIHKVIDGWNITHVRILTIKRAILIIDKLMSIPNLSFKDFKVTRLDLAANVKVRYPVVYYLNRLVYKPKYSRTVIGTSLYFNSKSKALCFYDKKNETLNKFHGNVGTLQRHKANVILKRGKHILRYEVRINQQVNKTFNRKNLFVRDLYDQEICSQYPEIWFNAFEEISMSKVFIFKPTTKKDVLDYLIGLGLNKHGELDKFVNELENMINKGVLKGTTKSNLINKVQAAYQNKVVAKEDKGVIDLTRRIQKRFETLKKKYSKSSQANKQIDKAKRVKDL